MREARRAPVFRSSKAVRESQLDARTCNLWFRTQFQRLGNCGREACQHVACVLRALFERFGCLGGMTRAVFCRLVFWQLHCERGVGVWGGVGVKRVGARRTFEAPLLEKAVRSRAHVG